MNLQLSYNASEDSFRLPPRIKQIYGPFGFPAPRDAGRPYISSNLVMGLDGRASFRELKGRAGGNEVSRSKEDRWLMDFLRAHHDAQLIGASTLREEPGKTGQGLDFAIADQELLQYRQEILKLGKQKIIVLTGSGEIDLSVRLFNSPRVEPWILTSAAGEKNLRSALQKLEPKKELKIIRIGEDDRVDLAAAAQLLRQQHGVGTLLCEGGPTLYGGLLAKQLIDEDFRTISLQVLGASTDQAIVRPTSYGNVSYTPETAPWFTLISLHYSLPYHAFLRLRYQGPRTFPV
ncbi:MAG TPA: dihydrofolate reductase family protein [Candidatus Acidoferrales bacterium]|jgi:riboflavin biosynthesis pyrimidine reductase|nr:dihydrofolate reductase family protein [Candidatus Acidoferrales bacterium]